MDNIQNLQAQSVSNKEFQFTVDYRYNSEHGDNVFLGAYALQNGQRLAWFGYGPARASRGNGRATIRLTFGYGNPPASVTTDQVEVMFYVGGGSAFYSKRFNYTKTWSLLAAPVQLSPASGTAFNNYPRTTTLRWSAASGAASYTVEVQYCQSAGCAVSAQNFRLVSNLTTTSYTFDFVGAQPGRWRVWAVDAAGHESPKTNWWGFSYTR